MFSLNFFSTIHVLWDFFLQYMFCMNFFSTLHVLFEHFSTVHVLFELFTTIHVLFEIFFSPHKKGKNEKFRSSDKIMNTTVNCFSTIFFSFSVNLRSFYFS